MNARSITQFPTATVSFFKQAREELRKVSWPSREATIRYTVIVVVSSVVVGFIIGGIDYILALILENLIA